MSIVTREDARIAVRTKVEALRQTLAVDIEYDNIKTIDLSMQTKPYMKVCLEYMDGMQVDMGPNGYTRAIGVILLDVRVKPNTGTKDQNAILEHYYRGLQKTDSMAPVRTLAARFDSAGVIDGWYSEAAVIPFWYDTQ